MTHWSRNRGIPTVSTFGRAGRSAAAVLGLCGALALGLTAAAAPQATGASATLATARGVLPPNGLNVAIGAKARTDAGAAAGSAVTAAVDGDGTTRFCPGSAGVHTLSLDLGSRTALSGIGVTFSGEEPNDGSVFSVTTSRTGSAGKKPYPGRASAGEHPITQGPLYLYGRSRARTLTLTWHTPRVQTVCVQEFRAFSTRTRAAKRLELGADLSTIAQDQAAGLTWSENGRQLPLLKIMKRGGMNYVRLRLWLHPTQYCVPSGCPDLANDLAMAKQIAANGMKMLLDIHYSDTWADPQHQVIPAAWQGESLSQLSRTVRSYTRGVIRAFAAQRTPVDQVAVGNEITQGFLWPTGQIKVDSRGRANWGPVTRLLKSGIAGAREGNPAGHKMSVQLHIDRGGDNATAREFFDQMATHHVDYDVIGLSYYPWYHGPMTDMIANLKDLAARYHMPVLIAENQFPWKPIGSYPGSANDYGSANFPDSLPGYPITPAGQVLYQRDLVSLVASLPHKLGLGVFYWSADTRDALGWFDSAGVAQPAVNAYRVRTT